MDNLFWDNPNMGLFRFPAPHWKFNVKTIYSEPYRSLLDLLREARTNAGITQAQLSESLGRPQSYVSKYERGDRRLDVIEFLEVCRYIDIDPYLLLRTIEKEID